MKLTVYGVPVPQGSKSARVVGGRAILTDGFGDKPRRMKEWRAAIACEARAWLAANGAPAPLDCAVNVSVIFYLPKPKSASKRVQYPATRPDADKLARCVNDSLTGIAYTDDSRIVNLSVQKRFAIDSPPRAEIAVEQTGELVA